MCMQIMRYMIFLKHIISKSDLGPPYECRALSKRSNYFESFWYESTKKQTQLAASQENALKPLGHEAGVSQFWTCIVNFDKGLFIKDNRSQGELSSADLLRIREGGGGFSDFSDADVRLFGEKLGIFEIYDVPARTKREKEFLDKEGGR